VFLIDNEPGYFNNQYWSSFTEAALRWVAIIMYEIQQDIDRVLNAVSSLVE
jgi:hypothetical protein